MNGHSVIFPARFDAGDLDGEDDVRLDDDVCHGCGYEMCVCDDPEYDETSWGDAPDPITTTEERIRRAARHRGVDLTDAEVERASLAIHEFYRDVTVWRLSASCTHCKARGMTCERLHCDDIIGRDGALPWHLPDDMRRFRALTLGSAVLMGRKTFESIGRPLDGRTNLVASRTLSPNIDGVWIVRDVRYELANVVCGDVFVIGGAEVYREALPFCTRAYVTRVHARTTGDALTRFPCDLSGWRVIESEKRRVDACHAHAFEFLTLERP